MEKSQIDAQIELIDKMIREVQTALKERGEWVGTPPEREKTELELLAELPREKFMEKLKNGRIG